MFHQVCHSVPACVGCVAVSRLRLHGALPCFPPSAKLLPRLLSHHTKSYIYLNLSLSHWSKNARWSPQKSGILVSQLDLAEVNWCSATGCPSVCADDEIACALSEPDEHHKHHKHGKDSSKATLSGSSGKLLPKGQRRHVWDSRRFQELSYQVMSSLQSSTMMAREECLTSTTWRTLELIKLI